MVMYYPKACESFKAINGLNVKVIIGPAPEWADQMVDVVTTIKPKLRDLGQVFLSQLYIAKKVIHLRNRLSVVRLSTKQRLKCRSSLESFEIGGKRSDVK